MILCLETLLNAKHNPTTMQIKWVWIISSLPNSSLQWISIVKMDGFMKNASVFGFRGNQFNLRRMNNNQMEYFESNFI